MPDSDTTEKNKVLRTILGSISHELRTPLAGIRGGLQSVHHFLPLLIETYLEAQKEGKAKGDLQSRQLNLLKQVVANMLGQTDSAFHIIDVQLKNISLGHIDNSQFEEHRISDIIDTALADYPLNAEEKSLIHWTKEEDFEFRGDAVLTKHVIWNLLKNALYYIKAARKGEISIRLASEEGQNKLYFKDTALGMPQDIAAQIFDQFFTQRATGTGLGLTFCKWVMQAYGGDITCEAVEGEHAEFILNFPAG